MIEDTIRILEKRLSEQDRLSSEAAGKLQDILGKLKTEIDQLAESNRDDAQSIAHFVSASTHEATRSEPKPSVLQAATDGLTSSIDEFGASHPELTKAVNALSKILMDLGI